MELKRFIICTAVLIILGFGIYAALTPSRQDGQEANGISIAQTEDIKQSEPVAETETVIEKDAELPDPDNYTVEISLNNPKIVIWKSDRRLDLFSDDEIVRSFRIGLGFTPEGDKQRQGDGCTPEGDFYVCVKNPHSRFYLSLGISYPNEEDADRGLSEGLINGEQHRRITYAIGHGQKPPWDTPLGGEICIHGHGSNSDWTLGCIALDNSDIEELYNTIPLGTPVVINP